MFDLRLIGDELYYRGQLVAVLVQSGVPASQMADFIDVLSGLPDTQAEPCDCFHQVGCDQHRAEVENPYDKGMNDLISNMKAFTRGGLIKIDDLKRIAEQLKEEVGKE